ncbi:pyruvate dehydrogenase (acetyl-transferring) E1 component subunit alpha [Nesterenkonia ebinurensis]|uniref:pyruvate dehydrogenase (acetyl-transferring) E1 component subunit alpha n=1 Tax=Nesterenkonia ebinurensis TaxID=2608252 RepID=UPI001CC36326|nr:pyruvate dehydrogenase (acetyl-transferring) E1 component subunit alpha [Nesterenkonia ebinurensis]
MAQITATEVEMVQALDAEGNRTPCPEYDDALSTLGAADLRRMYQDMVLLRRFDTQATALQRQGELGLWPPSLGQEAAQIGLGQALRPQDFVFGSYREHGVAFSRGLQPADLLGVFRGTSHGGWDPQKHRFHTYAIVIGTQTLHATGYAMGMNLQGRVGNQDPERDVATVTCFGDGATSQGDVSEALTFAGAYHAPVLFYCQNNQWAISEPVHTQTSADLYRRGEGFGIPGIRVDGNDVLACWAVAQTALEKVRSGAGPLFIEAYTYRRGPHTTADDPTKYRSGAEVEAWERRDPILRMQRYLSREGIIDDAAETELEERAEQFAAEVREACKAMPDPAPADMFSHAYREPHLLVQEEQENYLAYLASLDEEDEQ